MLDTCILFDLLGSGSTWRGDGVAVMLVRGQGRTDVGLG